MSSLDPILQLGRRKIPPPRAYDTTRVVKKSELLPREAPATPTTKTTTSTSTSSSKGPSSPPGSSAPTIFVDEGVPRIEQAIYGLNAAPSQYRAFSETFLANEARSLQHQVQTLQYQLRNEINTQNWLRLLWANERNRHDQYIVEAVQCKAESESKRASTWYKIKKTTRYLWKNRSEVLKRVVQVVEIINQILEVILYLFRNPVAGATVAATGTAIYYQLGNEDVEFVEHIPETEAPSEAPILFLA
jgi:hypothetical protein